MTSGTTYLVGGAVRDALMGRTGGDVDYVVVGATPEAMIAAGFHPLGRGFPVFAHPITGDEHALARKERKTGAGYRGFEVFAGPDVTLEEDLARRDFTVNAMARAPDGTLFDPWGGQRDLQARCLRHVSPAFCEDPVRVLRAARFASLGFTVAPETLALMRSMVDSGEVAHLVPERVWREFQSALSNPHPSAFRQTLEACGAWAVLFPEWQAAWGPSAAVGVDPALAFAALVSPETSENFRALSARLRVPSAFQDWGALAIRERSVLEHLAALTAQEVNDLLDRCNAWRQRSRVDGLAGLAEALGAPPAAGARLVQAHAAALAVALDTLGGPVLTGAALGQALRAARRDAIERTWTPPALDKPRRPAR